ncbi:hypothetical protein FACS189463_0920 [Bacteroidia bacterium]|nr:hypothetical protein FACS189463_0920 [Bacteroidia bacterium]
MKRIALKLIETILKIGGRKYILISQYQYDRLVNAFLNLSKLSNDNGEKELSSIVFSKDRAMQLYAFLRSYAAKIKHKSPIVILYTTSNEAHEASYNNLKTIFKEDDVTFIKETDFRKQLLEILEQATVKKVLFFVDDMILTHDFDFDTLKHVNTTDSIVCLSCGKDLTYSTNLKQTLELPVFQTVDGMLRFKWNDIKILSNWSYPLGLSGYMFGRKEILAILSTLTFKAPNSLEDSMQTFKPLFMNRFGLCTNHTIAVCVHANMVQTEGYNPVLGTFSVEELLTLWNENKQIDISLFFDKPAGDTQIQKYAFIDRD